MRFFGGFKIFTYLKKEGELVWLMKYILYAVFAVVWRGGGRGKYILGVLSGMYLANRGGSDDVDAALRKGPGHQSMRKIAGV